MAREPIGSMIENVPSQLNEEELAAEVEVEMPETLIHLGLSLEPCFISYLL